MLRTETRPMSSTVTLMQRIKPAAAKDSDMAAVKDIYPSNEQHSCPDAEHKHAAANDSDHAAARDSGTLCYWAIT